MEPERQMFNVSEIMTRAPYTLGPDDTLADASELMTQHHIRHIPIVSSDGTVIGVVTHRDVLAASDSTVLNKDHENENYVALSSIMSTPVQTIEENASLRGTAMRLQKMRMGCLPVVRGGELVGIITDSDFVTVAIHLMEQLEMVEPEDQDFA